MNIHTIDTLTKAFNEAGVTQFKIQVQQKGFCVYDIQGINSTSKVCQTVSRLGMRHSFLDCYMKEGTPASSMTISWIK